MHGSFNLKGISLSALFLAATLAATAPALAADHAVSIKGFAFSPAQLTVAAGDTVTFTNEDGAPHTATANDGGFDTGTIRSGSSATVTIGAAGDHAYKCNFHPSMTGTVSAN